MQATSVKIGSAYYQAISKLADDLGMSIREITDQVLSNGLSGLRSVGKKIAEDGDLLSKLQEKVDKAGADNLQDQLSQLKKDNLRLQTRLAGLEKESADEELESVSLTKEDLLNSKRAIKPGKTEEEDETEYFCKDCKKEGKDVVLDPDEDTEVCPGCGRKINWEGEGGIGGMGWVLAALAAALLLGGTRRSY